MQRRFRQVDVFGVRPFSGNPVAVVLDSEGLTDEDLRKFSVWTNLSECTFILPPTTPEADYRVRIFSLSTELPFAGHPTLGTARAWLDAGGVPRKSNLVIQECEAGLIPIRIEDQNLAFVSPPRFRSGPVAPEYLNSVIEILGISHEQVIDAEWLDNGPGWVGLLLDSAETVLGLRPNASAHPGRWDIGVVAKENDGSDAALVIRAFFTEGHEPLREDPITGSLNASVAEWLIGNGTVSAPYIASQGTAMGREGRVFISEDEGKIWVGGGAEVVLSGYLEKSEIKSN
jgi:PhzF family phenazine biosynthesis protein